MKIKRILGLLLVLAALTSVFASCEKAAAPGTLIADAEAALKTAPYTVISTVEYASPDEDLSAIIASFSIPAIRVGVDGDKFNAYMYIKSGEKDNYVNYTYVDETLYVEWYENGQTYTEKKAFTDKERDEIVFTLGSGVNISIDDFNDVSSKKKDGVDTIYCKKIKGQSLGGLIAMLEENLSAVDAKVDVKDAALTVNVTDGKYSSTSLTCEYYVTTELGCYVINMTYNTRFDYESGVSISAPSF